MVSLEVDARFWKENKNTNLCWYNF